MNKSNTVIVNEVPIEIKYIDIHFSTRQEITSDNDGASIPTTTGNRKRTTYLVVHVLYSDSQGYSGTVTGDLQKLSEISINPGESSDQFIYTSLKTYNKEVTDINKFLKDVIDPMIIEDIKSKMLSASERHHNEEILNQYKSMDRSFQG